jgi:stalled ribosome alternative rescue factor ArfA
MNKLRKLVVRNPMAKEVRTPKYAKRVVRSRKGSGSYTRSAVTKSRLDGFYDSWAKA